MHTIFSIAKNTFRQTIRDRILYGILIFALLFIGSSIVLGSLGLEENLFIIRTFGLAGIYLFGLIITIFLGASIVYEEVEKRTTYVLLSKPVTKADIIVGKFFGLFMGICTTTLLMTVAYILIVYLSNASFDYMSLLTVGLQLLEMAVLISILILFSIFTTPLASIIYTILLVYIGHSLSAINTYTDSIGGLGKIVLNLAYYLLPNLEKFNIRDAIVHNVGISVSSTLVSIGYALIYIVLALFLAKLAFDKKDL